KSDDLRRLVLSGQNLLSLLLLAYQAGEEPLALLRDGKIKGYVGEIQIVNALMDYGPNVIMNKLI
ncbi:MAG: stage sporulation protein, partial [Clostridiales bacterium]|nr:stage sporulation protein [Clostridiales bacterium]